MHVTVEDSRIARLERMKADDDDDVTAATEYFGSIIQIDAPRVRRDAALARACAAKQSHKPSFHLSNKDLMR